MKPWIVRDAGSVPGEGGQWVRRQGEVGDAGLHVHDEVERRGAASRGAGRARDGGGRGVVTWRGRLHVWHGSGQSERPSDVQ